MNIATAHQPPTPDMRFSWRGVDAERHSEDRCTHRAGRSLRTRHAQARETVHRRTRATRARAAPQTRAADVTLFTRQLASLLRAGLPLAPSLELLAPGRRFAPARHAANRRRAGARHHQWPALLRGIAAASCAVQCAVLSTGRSRRSGRRAAGRARPNRRRPRTRRRAARQGSNGAHLSGRDPAAGDRHHRSTAGLGRADLQTDLRRLRRQLPAPTQFVLALSAGAARWSMPGASI